MKLARSLARFAAAAAAAAAEFNNCVFDYDAFVSQTTLLSYFLQVFSKISSLYFTYPALCEKRGGG